MGRPGHRCPAQRGVRLPGTVPSEDPVWRLFPNFLLSEGLLESFVKYHNLPLALLWRKGQALFHQGRSGAGQRSTAGKAGVRWELGPAGGQGSLRNQGSWGGQGQPAGLQWARAPRGPWRPGGPHLNISARKVSVSLPNPDSLCFCQ